MTTYERHHRIVRILASSALVTKAELAAELGVCIRQIGRDLDELTPYHPIDTKRGRNGGVYLQNNVYLGQLTDSEENFLLAECLRMCNFENYGVSVATLHKRLGSVTYRSRISTFLSEASDEITPNFP